MEELVSACYSIHTLNSFTKPIGYCHPLSADSDSMHKRLSMDPSARVKLAKLEWVSYDSIMRWLNCISSIHFFSQALSYMGYLVTSEQKEQIYSTLDIDGEGRVVFLDFVQLAKEMFAFRLDDARLEASLVYALTQKDSLDMPSFPKKV